jgi:hypothetical protein
MWVTWTSKQFNQLSIFVWNQIDIKWWGALQCENLYHNLLSNCIFIFSQALLCKLDIVGENLFVRRQVLQSTCCTRQKSCGCLMVQHFHTKVGESGCNFGDNWTKWLYVPQVGRASSEVNYVDTSIKVMMNENHTITYIR